MAATTNRVAQVNAYIKKFGLDVTLRRGRGYYYFTGADGWRWASVYIYRASDMTLAEWKSEVAERVREHNVAGMSTR